MRELKKVRRAEREKEGSAGVGEERRQPLDAIKRSEVPIAGARSVSLGRQEGSPYPKEIAMQFTLDLRPGNRRDRSEAAAAADEGMVNNAISSFLKAIG